MENSKSRQYWSTEEIQALLAIYCESDIQKQLDGIVRNDDVYKLIVRELEKVGIIRNVKQVREKIKKLKQQYKTVHANNNKSGAARHSFPWYDLMHSVLGHRPATSGAGLRNTTNFTATDEGSLQMGE